MKRRRFLILTFILLAVVGPTMSSSRAQVKTLTLLCSPQEDWCIAQVQAFEERTGIETSYVRLSTGDSLARLRATQSDPEFSVWWGGPADAFIAAYQEGLLEPYEPPLAAVLPETAIGEDHAWHGIYMGAIGFCSNKRLLDELGVAAPTSWEDLLNPALQGNIAMAHPATSGTAFTTLWTIVTLKADALEAQEAGSGYTQDNQPAAAAFDAALEYFARLDRNIVRYTRAGAAPGEMAANGEVAMAVMFAHDCIKLQLEGFQDVLQNTFPQEGTGFEIGGMALIKGAAEPDAAKQWIDWALTPEAQAIGQTVDALQLPTNPNTPVSALSPKLSEIKLVNYNFEAAGRNRSAVVARFSTEIAPQPTG